MGESRGWDWELKSTRFVAAMHMGDYDHINGQAVDSPTGTVLVTARHPSATPTPRIPASGSNHGSTLTEIRKAFPILEL